MKKQLFFNLFLFLIINVQAQPGCTDPQANNYDSAATENDGSCQYPETNYVLGQIAELPDILIENSGLAHLPQGLFTHNDAGNSNEIYRIDPADGSILQTLLVIGENEDWEDMAESDTHLFIGDFGNNKGDRTDLRIYRIDKAELGNNVLNAQPINFSFADQMDFSENQNNHDYDCEAFFFYNDSLHLFTKNWVDNKTRHYTIPAEPGFHSASPKETFDVGGLITSADINEEGTVLLLGYTEVGLNFMWMLFHYPNNTFFSGHKRRIELGSGLTNSQTEAIVFQNIDEGYISSEQFDLGQVELAPKLLSFDISQWIPELVSTTNFPLKASSVKSFPNPFNNTLTFELPHYWSSTKTTIKVFDLNGKLLLENEEIPIGEIIHMENLSGLKAGAYVFQLSDGTFIAEQRVIKK